jgi:putative membrane protein
MDHMDGVGPYWLPLLVLVPAAGAYLVAVGRLHRRGDAWPVARSLWAAVGLSVLTASLLPPLADAMSFPAHIVQHLMLSMLAPLALALSAPVTLALRTLPLRGRRMVLRAVQSRFARVITLAPTVLLLDVGGMYAYYLTPLFAETERHPWLHVTVHAHMFLAGCLLSWYLVGPDIMPTRPRIRTSVLVLFVAAGSHDLLAKLMYADLRPTGGGSAAQIRTGAQVMYYGGDAVELLLAVGLLAGWYARTGRALGHQQRRNRVGSA